jgi:ankyrin repeat protein
MCRAYGTYLLIVRCSLVCQSADSLAERLAGYHRPTLVDTAFIIASAGYHEEAYTCTRLCQATYMDDRLLEPLVRHTFGESQRTMLMAAVRSGNAERVSQLLDCGAPINAEMPWGHEGEDSRSPLQEACRKGHEAVAQLLIDRDADIHCEGLLRFACAGGLTSIVEYLIDEDAASAEDISDDLMLCYACEGGGSESLVRWLIDRGADVNAEGLSKENEDDEEDEEDEEDESSSSPLFLVVSSASRAPKPSDAAITRLLIENGADAKLTNDEGETLLHMACNADVARVLIENGCDVNACDERDRRPLMSAIFSGREDVARLLVEHGAHVNATTENEYTPLHSACKWAKEGIVRFLLDRGADPNAVDELGCTPLHEVCDQEFWDEHSKEEEEEEEENETWQPPFVSDFDDAKGAHGWPPSQQGRAAIARLLLDQGVDVNARNSYERTPLHLVLQAEYAHESSEAIARLLIERGATINASDRYGQSILHAAASHGHKYAADVLAEAKGVLDVDVRDTQKQTPLHCACQATNEPFARLLLKLGADVNARDSWGRTPLHDSHGPNDLPIALLLIDHGADVLARDSTGHLPLDSAKAYNKKLADVLTKLVAAATEAASSAGSGSGSGSGGNTAERQ